MTKLWIPQCGSQNWLVSLYLSLMLWCIINGLFLLLMEPFRYSDTRTLIPMLCHLLTLAMVGTRYYAEVTQWSHFCCQSAVQRHFESIIVVLVFSTPLTRYMGRYTQYSTRPTVWWRYHQTRSTRFGCYAAHFGKSFESYNKHYMQHGSNVEIN